LVQNWSLLTKCHSVVCITRVLKCAKDDQRRFIVLVDLIEHVIFVTSNSFNYSPHGNFSLVYCLLYSWLLFLRICTSHILLIDQTALTNPRNLFVSSLTTEHIFPIFSILPKGRCYTLQILQHHGLRVFYAVLHRWRCVLSDKSTDAQHINPIA
jgi:hypothetical protein